MSLRTVLPALLFLPACEAPEVPVTLGAELAEVVATSGQDQEGQGGGLPATVSLTLDVGSADVVGLAYDVGTIEVELGELGWRPLTEESTGGTDEMMVELEPVYLLPETITGFRISFDAAAAQVDGEYTPVIIAPVETAGSWPTARGSDYTITLTVDGGPLEEDLQGQHWDAELTVTDFTELVAEDTGQ